MRRKLSAWLAAEMSQENTINSIELAIDYFTSMIFYASVAGKTKYIQGLSCRGSCLVISTASADIVMPKEGLEEIKRVLEKFSYKVDIKSSIHNATITVDWSNCLIEENETYP